MCSRSGFILALAIGTIITTPPLLYAETEATPAKPAETSSIKEMKESATFSDWINERNYYIKIDTRSEKEKVREQWKRALGIDVFLPYFKAKELAKKTEKKTKTKVFKLKGKAKIEEDEVKYIFKLKF